MVSNSSITIAEKSTEHWYACECCGNLLRRAEPLPEGADVYLECGCERGKVRQRLAHPACRQCGTILDYLGQDCPCSAAVAQRELDAADKQSALSAALANQAELDRKESERIAQRMAHWQESLAVSGAARAARPPTVKEREAALKDKELTEREERQARIAARRLADNATVETADTTEDLTFADFGQAVTLLDVERLPAAFERVDGETLLYEGLANTIYGEPSTGKSWIGLMVAIQQLRAGRRVIWLDNEDRATTLARRLQLLRATDLIGVDDLAWRTGDLHQSETAMTGALAFLDGGNGPGLVVIDSATSFGCPKDGADVQPWIRAVVKPWINAGHTTLLLDHVPKQRKDRPAGAVGSYEKLSDIRGAALYAHGTAWNGQDGGAVHLTIHKDAHGQLPAPKFAAVATITAEWDGPTLNWRVDLPNTKADGEDLQTELMDALEQAGSDGVRGSRAVRDLLKGKRAKDIDAARDELVAAGLIEKRPDGGNAQRYILVN